MGCVHSTPASEVAAKASSSVTSGLHRCGSFNSNNVVVPVVDDGDILDNLSDCSITRQITTSGKTRWKMFVNTSVARKKFIDEGSLPPDAPDAMFELLLFMEERDLMRSLLDYVSGSVWKNYLICWAEIEAFKSVDPAGFDKQKSIATYIFNKYCKVGSDFYLEKILKSGDTPQYESIIADAHERCPLPTNLYREVQLGCVQSVYQYVWLSYRTDKMYRDAVNSLKHYNHVDVDDFLYMEKLGQGGFGFVVHSVKTSTGKHYAMKVQSKIGLLDCFDDCPHRVTFERQAMSMCNHPFIVGLDYAFQTTDYVIMAMELGRCK